MENGQNTENIDFINELLNKIHAEFSNEENYAEFQKEFTRELDSTTIRSFEFLMDSIEKARQFKIKLPINLINNSIKSFLNTLLNDYTTFLHNKTINTALIHRKIKEINPNDIIIIHDYIIKYINDDLLSKLPELSKVNQEIQTAKQEIESTKNVISKKLEDTGTSIFISHYKAIQDEEIIAKCGWLLLTAIFGSILLYFVCGSLYDILTIETLDLHKTIFKTVYIFAVLIIFLWISRQYSLSKRQFLIYRHLASAINSYSLINESISNYTDLKKALLCEVAKTIFPIPDGKVADSQQVPLLQLLDLAKSATNKDQDKPG